MPGALPLRCVAAWLRAVPSFEEWLPMISFGGDAHPVLGAAAAAIPTALRAARMELGFEAFEASAELVEAALPLINDVKATDACQTVVPLLAAFAETCAQLPLPGAPLGSGSAAQCLQQAGMAEVCGVLTGVVHAVFSSLAPLACDGLWQGMLVAAARLLVLAGPCGGLEADGGGGSLMDRNLAAWEVLAQTHRDACEADPQELGPHVAPAMEAAFVHFMRVLPQSLVLPSTLQKQPEDLSQWRSRMPQTLIVWCSEQDKRVAVLMEALQVGVSRLPPPSAATRPASYWADLELVLCLAAAAAGVIASSGEASALPLPEPLPSLCAALPQLPLASAHAPWVALVAGGMAEFIVALDPWITPDRFPLAADGTRKLLALLFDLAGGTSPGAACGSPVEALSVVISNLAAPLASSPDMGVQALNRLQHLCLGASGLSPNLRERLLVSALGPLLSQFPKEQLAATMEGLAAPLREAAPRSPGNSGTAVAADADIAARLLFQLLAAPQVEQHQVEGHAAALEWLSVHWPWLEAALAPGQAAASEQTIEAACHALTCVLSRARSNPVAAEALRRGVPLLVGAAVSRGSTAALSGVTSLVRVFRGGSEEAIARLFATCITEASCGLIGGGAESSSARQLPPDLLSAVLELLCVSLAPRCAMLASFLLREPRGPVAAGALAASYSLPDATSPRLICWGLMLFERLTGLLEKPQMMPQAAQILDATISSTAAACCQLLAVSPVVLDPEVPGKLGCTLLALSRARPGPVRVAILQALGPVGISQEEGEILLQQVCDPAAEEQQLAESLRDTASVWQAEHLRKSLLG
eukprot:gnl/TRDRNA2_/TRDRNA2_153601_c0_seq1.p1 gnl/TRDRNA2_/TRDRNA2_153601_c0~~gnl/TRDRNA2_/TRDRNA2_153601_c0_seq1.p1  ORF type:complete len:861 (+),score=180.67 gnl/TRDRNA2_/TRDRNA2_153601_c0_seq1:138-2585(+)